MKRFSLILIFCTIASIQCAYTFDFTVDGIYYDITSSSEVKVVSNGYFTYSGEVVIPSIVTYDSKTYSVTRIGDEAFCRCPGLTSITIPESVTRIGDKVFEYCSSLTSITIPESVTSIGYYTFDDCTSLKEVVFKDGSETLSLGCSLKYPDYHGLFYDCPIETVYLGRDLKYETGETYGYSPFYNKTKLTTLTIGDSVTTIRESAFRGCSSLASIIIPEGVTSIEGNAFDGTAWYSNLPDGLVYIGNMLYKFKGTIPENTFIKVKEGTKGIVGNAFSSQYGLTSVVIPESVASIGDFTFDDCTALKEVIFEDGSETLSLGFNHYHYSKGEGLFYDCPLETVYMGRNLSYLSGQDYGNSPFKNKTKLTTLTIGDNVTRFEENAFSGCSSLTSITIPKGVTRIGNSTFDDCTALKEVIFEDGSKTLSLGYNPNNAYGRGGLFYDCPLETVYMGRNLSYDSRYNTTPFYKTKLTTLTIGDSVTSIGYSAFSGCSSLTSITLPESVTNIGDSAFDGCTGELILHCNISPAEWSYSNDKRFSGSNFSRITIGDNVTSIGQNAFCGANNGNLKLLVVGAGMTSMESRFFADCDVNKVIWRGSVCKSIGKINYTSNTNFSGNSNFKVYPMLNSMFEAGGLLYVPISLSERTCDVISTIYNPKDSVVNVEGMVSYRNIPFEVKRINPYSFCGNKNITEVTLANKGNIDQEAFRDCESLRKINVDWTSDTNLDSGSGCIDDSAFENCTALSEVHLSDGVLGIGDYTFKGCTSLPSIELPDRLAFLGAYVFENCTALSSFVLPASVDAIGYALFSGCNSLKSIKVAEGNTNYDSRNDCNAIIETASNTLTTACNATTIPTGVTSIWHRAYSGCDEITTISLSKEIASVGDYAFQGCSKLANIIIEDRTQPLTLGSNGSNALFSDCPLDSVYIGGKLSYNTSSNKGYSPFSRNESLRTVIITDKEDKIYDYEFYNCASLENVVVGDVVLSIGNNAFSGCTSLESFSFGSSMKTIGNNAFTGCTNISKIISRAVNPPVCGTLALDDINKWECVLKIPISYAAAYQTADQWKEFLFIEDVVEVDRYALTFIVDGEIYHSDSLAYSETIVLPDIPAKEGYTFVWIDEIPETMPAMDIVINGSYVSTDISNAKAEEHIVRIYTLDGQQVSELRQGFNIVWMKNGSIRKVYIK